MTNHQYNMQNYKVVERSSELIERIGKTAAISQCRAELNAVNDNWSDFSGDCAGHASTCLKMMISYMEGMK